MKISTTIKDLKHGGVVLPSTYPCIPSLVMQKMGRSWGMQEINLD
jgi:hypothetical protein